MRERRRISCRCLCLFVLLRMGRFRATNAFGIPSSHRPRIPTTPLYAEQSEISKKLQDLAAYLSTVSATQQLLNPEAAAIAQRSMDEYRQQQQNHKVEEVEDSVELEEEEEATMMEYLPEEPLLNVLPVPVEQSTEQQLPAFEHDAIDHPETEDTTKPPTWAETLALTTDDGAATADAKPEKIAETQSVPPTTTSVSESPTAPIIKEPKTDAEEEGSRTEAVDLLEGRIPPFPEVVSREFGKPLPTTKEKLPPLRS